MTQILAEQRSVEFRAALDAAVRHSFAFLDSLDQRPANATADIETLRRNFRKELMDRGIPAEQIVEELARDAEPGLHGNAGGRFFAWVIGGAVDASLAADWLSAAWDQNAGMYAVSPAAAIVEEIVGEWLKDLLRLPKTASFALVTGGQMANTTGIAAGRYRVLANKGWDVEKQGLFGAPKIRVVTGKHKHATIARAVRLLGMGTDCIVDLPLNKEWTLDAAALEADLAAHKDEPTIVLMQAGEINTGVYDDFRTLIPIAKKYGAWVHIDGAFGLWSASSPKLRHFMNGADQADSWATDGHKWLNVPYDCGYAFVADPEAHRAAMSQRAAYLVSTDTVREQVDWNPEFSRRARGFPTYAAIRQLGRDGIAAMIERCCAHAHSITVGIGALKGAELLWEPLINQGLVRFPDPRPDATSADHDRNTEAVISKIVATGEAFFGPTTWNGHRAMRISVCNWQTSESDVARAIAAARKVLAG
ncbi:MAG: aminotransferase class V-fold PLP-dependent enzyme [Bryobacteraceae bacterium]